MEIKDQSNEIVKIRYRLRVCIRKNVDELKEFGINVDLKGDNISTLELNRYITKIVGRFRDMLKKYDIECPRAIDESFVEDLKNSEEFEKISEQDRNYINSSFLKLAIKSIEGKTIEDNSISPTSY